ncbi:hypothetical protein SAMN02745207_03691 [Clostridium grantii DSM 8605]|uniref:Uncharacterized protein n=1 Tax=Clostridium grantii DSM 8605 TaxID=1121316 RepID=A0A1M5XIH4_9CLOT|nr:hypothetical protein SAMN02745207_03691 [Clostridium grantii DSM 8605]
MLKFNFLNKLQLINNKLTSYAQANCGQCGKLVVNLLVGGIPL